MTDTFDSTTFATLARSRTALLTTFRRSGQAVTSPVSLVVNDGRAYFVTAVDSGKAKRVARTDRVELAPCTAAGKPLGGTVAGSARAVIGVARPAFRGDAPDRSAVLELGAVSNQASRHVPLRGRSRRGLACEQPKSGSVGLEVLRRDQRRRGGSSDR